MVGLADLLEEKGIEEEAEITKLDQKTAGEVFGQKARRPERRVLVIWYRTSSGAEFKETHGMPQGIELENGEFKVVDRISAMRSLKNPNSWLARFIRTYKSEPKVGMKVKVVLNPKGFPVIRLI